MGRSPGQWLTSTDTCHVPRPRLASALALAPGLTPAPGLTLTRGRRARLRELGEELDDEGGRDVEDGGGQEEDAWLG